MKKSLFELTIEEFIRVICDCPKTYCVSMKYANDEGCKQEDEVRGTYDQIIDIAILSKCEWLMKYAKENLFDYDVHIDELEIYNYLDEKTNHFEHERVKIVLRQMEATHLMEIDEERLQIINDKIENGWEGYKMRKGKRWDDEKKRLVEDENTEEIEYKDTYEKVFGIAYDFFYHTAIDLLKRKICLNTEGYTARADEDSCKENDLKTTGEEDNDRKEHSGKNTKKAAGRPVRPFDDVIAEEDKEAIKERLHALIDGKSGKGAVLYIKAAIILGLIQRPTHKQFKSEFRCSVSSQSYNNCLGGNVYTEDEIEGAKTAIGKI